MRLSRRHRDYDLGFRLTPLVDVVFLLIIFFMTISQISRTNAHLIQVPRVAPAWGDSQPQVLAITIDRWGAVTAGGQPLPLETLDGWITERLHSAGGDAGRLQVLLRHDHRGNSAVLNELVRRLAAQGITRVRLAVAPE